MGVFTAAGAIGVKVLEVVGVSVAATSFGAIAVGFLTQAAVGLALNALTPKPSSESRTAIGGYRLNARQPNLDHQIIYGETRVGGAIVFEDNSRDIWNAVLYRVYAHAGHEIEGYREIYIGDNKVTKWRRVDNDELINRPDQAPNGTTLTPCRMERGPNDRYEWITGETKGAIRLRFYNGTQTSADGPLVRKVNKWKDRCVLNNISYMVGEFFHGAGETWPNGVPEITCVIRGKPVYDPRSDSTSWSDNPALCLRDYITSDYGLGEANDSIDDTLVSTAANVCDQTNTLDGSARYTCNGAFTTAVTPIDLLNEMLTSMGGLLWYAQGKWRMKPAYYTAPTLELTEDDLRSSVAVKTRHSRRDNFNIVRGTFKGPESKYEFTDYPEVRQQAFISADNGQESVVDLDLRFTDTSKEARRIARIFLERNRQQLTVSAAFGMKAFQVQVGDIIQLTVSRFGWTQKEFEVASWTFGLANDQDLQVQMTLREISESVFDEVNDGIVYERDNTELADAFFVPPIGLGLEDSIEIVYEHARNVITATVTGQIDRINYVEVQHKLSSDTEWIPAGTGNLGKYRIVDLIDGLYDVRARAVNYLGAKGEWVVVEEYPAKGLSVPPEQVENLSLEVNGPVAHLEWSPVADLDLSYYRLRYSSVTSGAQWSDAIDYVKKIAKPATEATVPALAGTYMIKAVDQSGVESNDMTSVVLSANNLEGFANSATQTEDPTFTGTKTNTIVDSNELRLRGYDNFDSLTGNLDDLTGLWDDLGFAGVAAGATGTYEFSDHIDAGSVVRARVRVDADLSRFDYNSANNLDAIPGEIDAKPNDWDDLTGNPDFGDIDVDYFVSTTDDDPAGTPTWSGYTKIRSADIQARAFRFKAELKSDSEGVTPSISELDAVIQYN